MTSEGTAGKLLLRLALYEQNLFQASYEKPSLPFSIRCQLIMDFRCRFGGYAILDTVLLHTFAALTQVRPLRDVLPRHIYTTLADINVLRRHG